MALDLSKVPEDVLESLEERGHSRLDIERMSAIEAFNEACMWEGIIGYGRRFYRQVLALKEAES